MSGENLLRKPHELLNYHKVYNLIWSEHKSIGQEVLVGRSSTVPFVEAYKRVASVEKVNGSIYRIALFVLAKNYSLFCEEKGIDHGSLHTNHKVTSAALSNLLRKIYGNKWNDLQLKDQERAENKLKRCIKSGWRYLKLVQRYNEGILLLLDDEVSSKM